MLGLWLVLSILDDSPDVTSTLERVILLMKVLELWLVLSLLDNSPDVTGILERVALLVKLELWLVPSTLDDCPDVTSILERGPPVTLWLVLEDCVLVPSWADCEEVAVTWLDGELRPRLDCDASSVELDSDATALVGRSCMLRDDGTKPVLCPWLLRADEE